MNIDAQIREILTRSSAVNDNSTLNKATLQNKPEHYFRNNGEISVVGDNNIVLCSSWLSILTSFILAALILFSMH